jgi:transcriptional activator of cad operon
MNGDVDSLGKASALLDDVIKGAGFSYAYAEKTLVDVLRHSQQPLNKEQLGALYAEISRVGDMPGIKDTAVFIKLKQVKVDEAYNAINTAIDLRCRG